MTQRMMIRDNGLTREATAIEAAANAANVSIKANATVGAANLTPAEVAAGVLLRRTGSTGAYADVMPIATALTAAFPAIEDGQSIRSFISNRVGFIDTLTASAGTTAVAGSVLAIPANTGMILILTRVSAVAWTFELV